MRAVRRTERGIEVVEVPRPEPGPGEVRVRVAAAGICGSDLHLVGFGPLPATLGHEVAGRLDDGTPVVVWPSRPCGTCDRCTANVVSQCRTGAAEGYGVGSDGGMADEMVVGAANAFVLPDALDLGPAVLVEPIACAVHAYHRGGVRPADRVAVVGAGPIGLAAVAVAGWHGSPVGVVARHAHQREAAARLGATLDPIGEHDVVVDAAGTSSALRRALRLLRPGGTLILLATHWEPVELPALFGSTEPTIVAASTHGVHEGVHDMTTAMRVLVDRPELAAACITHRYPLDAASAAFATAGDRAGGAIKVVLEP